MANQMTQIALAELSSPARNNFFYGKLMGVQQFQLEQAYFLRQRWLLNRLGLGSGVLCGLEVVPTEDGQKLWLRPGVALDGLGREILVPSAYCIENPRQPTDDCGRPAGDQVPADGRRRHGRAGDGSLSHPICQHAARDPALRGADAHGLPRRPQPARLGARPAGVRRHVGRVALPRTSASHQAASSSGARLAWKSAPEVVAAT